MAQNKRFNAYFAKIYKAEITQKFINAIGNGIVFNFVEFSDELCWFLLQATLLKMCPWKQTQLVFSWNKTGKSKKKQFYIKPT